MIVRPARVEDAKAVAAVSTAAWRTGYAGIMPDEFLAKLDVSQAANRWTRTLEQGRASIIVLEARRTPVLGFCKFGPSRKKDAAETLGEVHALNVDPDYWGKGYGTELLRCACKGLAAVGYLEAELWTSRQSERSRKFYESRGWTDCEEERNDLGFGFDMWVCRYKSQLDPAP